MKKTKSTKDLTGYISTQELLKKDKKAKLYISEDNPFGTSISNEGF